LSLKNEKRRLRNENPLIGFFKCFDPLSVKLPKMKTCKNTGQIHNVANEQLEGGGFEK